MEERSWKLGEDLSTEDNLFDPITFDELILTVYCNCSKITPKAVCEELQNIILGRLDDCTELLERNAAEIIRLAKEGRETA